MANLDIGINLDKRTLSLNIPDGTTISELKYIAKVNSNNYIAEDIQNGVSIGYYHFLNENDEAETSIFYQYDGNSTSVNIENFTLPDNFGTITEVDETATLFDYISRNSHEKVYVVSEDFAKTESMDKNAIKAFIRGYGVPVGSIFEYDGDDVPEGFEVEDDFYDPQITLVGSELDFKNVLNLKSVKINGDTFQESSPTTDDPKEINFINGTLPIVINSNSINLNLDNIILNTDEYIYSLNDKWYWHKTKLLKNLNGTENYSRVSSGTDYYAFALTSYQSEVDKSKANNLLCNMLYPVDDGNPVNSCRISPSGNIVLSVPTSFCSYNASSLKSKLEELDNNNTPMQLLLPLNESVDIEITDQNFVETLNEILYYSDSENIHISVSFSDLTPSLEVTAYKNTLSGQVEKNTDDIENNIKININSKDDTTIDKTFKNFNIKTDYYNNTLIYKIILNNIEEIKVLPTNKDLVNPGGVGSLNVLDFAKNNENSLICNFGVFDTTTLKLKGHAIFDGTTYSNNNASSGSGYYYNGTDENHNLMSVSSLDISSVSDLVELGFKNCSISWKPIILNGQVLENSDVSVAPRQVLIQTYDNKFIILSTMGRDLFNKGLNMQELANYIQNNISNVKTALNVDGGGSVQTVYNKKPLFPVTDLSTYDGRVCSDVIIFKIKGV